MEIEYKEVLQMERFYPSNTEVISLDLNHPKTGAQHYLRIFVKFERGDKLDHFYCEKVYLENPETNVCVGKIIDLCIDDKGVEEKTYYAYMYYYIFHQVDDLFSQIDLLNESLEELRGKSQNSYKPLAQMIEDALAEAIAYSSDNEEKKENYED